MNTPKAIKVLYLCDGQACESPYRSCRTDGFCRHTTDPRHAVNGACEHPELEPARFGYCAQNTDANGIDWSFYYERNPEEAVRENEE